MPELPDVVVYIERLTPRILGQPLQRLRLLTPAEGEPRSTGGAEGQRRGRLSSNAVRLQPVPDGRRWRQPERDHLAAGEHGRQHPGRARRHQYQGDVLRRLLQGFQEGIRRFLVHGLRRGHQIQFAAAHDRAAGHILPNAAHLLDADVLTPLAPRNDDVDIRVSARGDAPARITNAARVKG